MGNTSKKLTPSKFVNEVVKDPKSPVGTLLLQGYVGESSEAGHARLYFDPQLTSHVDIPEDAILHSQEVPAAHSPLGGTYVWIKRDAKLIHSPAASDPQTGSFLEGQVFNAPPPSAPIICPTPLHGCPPHTPLHGCPPFTPLHGCPPPHTPLHGCPPPTPPVLCHHTLPPQCFQTPPAVCQVHTAPPVCIIHTAPVVCQPHTVPPQCIVHTSPVICQVHTIPPVCGINTASPVCIPQSVHCPSLACHQGPGPLALGAAALAVHTPHGDCLVAATRLGCQTHNVHCFTPPQTIGGHNCPVQTAVQCHITALCPINSVHCPTFGHCPSAVDACPSAPAGCGFQTVACGFQSVACGHGGFPGGIHQ